MLCEDGFAKEYKNGNITIKLDPVEVKKIRNRENTGEILEMVSECLFWIDTYFVGEEYCVSNYECGIDCYNYRRDLMYCFPFHLLDDLREGKTVRLRARKPDEDDRGIINSWYDD